MAKIADSRGRADQNSGYTRLFGNQALGQLMSQVQATVIHTGNELEKLLKTLTPATIQTTIEDAIDTQEPVLPIQVVFVARVSTPGSNQDMTIDIVMFDHYQQKVKVIELKDGDTFDTKKSSGELASMKRFAAWIAQRIDYSVEIYFCAFNQESKEAIVRGAKGRFLIEQAMTGRELCNLLGLDYESIRQQRQQEQPENLVYFITELRKIPEVRQIAEQVLRELPE